MNILLNIFFIIAIFILLKYDSLKQVTLKLLAIVGVFTMILFIAILPKFVSPQYKLQISAKNEKNIDAEGSEIWLSKVIINGIAYSPAEIFSSGWISEKDSYVWRSYKQINGMTNSIHATFFRKDSVELIFQKNKWRGKILIHNGNKAETLDLYANTESTNETYTYTVSPSFAEGGISSQKVFLIILVSIFFLSMLYKVYCRILKIEYPIQKNVSPNKNRIIWLDLLKVSCAFMIVLIHASGTYFNQTAIFSENWYKMLWINVIPRFAVPCFLMITGILYLKRKDSFNYTISQAKRIGLILLIWSCIYILARKLIWNAPQSSIVVEVLKIPFMHVASPLWYGYELIWIFLTLPFWQSLYQNITSRQRFYFVSVTLFLPAVLDYFGRILFLGNGGYAPFGSHVLFLNYIGLLFLGAFLYEILSKYRKTIVFVWGTCLVCSGVILMLW